MADQMGRSHGDARLRFMAPAIRHAQQGEIALTHDAGGVSAVAIASATCSATTPI
ncbi:hypothetical protein CIT37_13050 [Bradyrhizobium ottawaense]|uniref:hypothetical protein n=1 Tax=Bradyrhizobium ottawaense TaxID=931866 RepID=UPI00157F888D|nr:hypothetical protein [Bradyrhizobium ottawaense]